MLGPSLTERFRRLIWVRFTIVYYIRATAESIAVAYLCRRSQCSFLLHRFGTRLPPLRNCGHVQEGMRSIFFMGVPYPPHLYSCMPNTTGLIEHLGHVVWRRLREC